MSGRAVLPVRMIAVLVLLVALGSTAGAAARSIRLVVGNTRAMVDGQEQVLDVPPQIVNDRTLVPLRFVAESMGLQVDWDGNTRTVTLSGEGLAIRLQIDHREARVGDSVVTLDVPPTIQAGRTLVPLRFVAESLGLAVGWDGTTRTIALDRPAQAAAAVAIANYAFQPATLTVKTGTTVVWTNQDPESHNVIANGHFDSGILDQGAAFRWTFTAPGTYTYYCDQHSGMDGTIIVTDG